MLFNSVDKLLYRKSDKCYPTTSSPDKLANRFADFFYDKIANIRNDLSAERCPITNTQRHTFHTELTEFQHVTEDQVRNLIKSPAVKSRDLDPFPAKLMKNCMETLMPAITKIVNTSLGSATMPVQFKQTMVRPKLKKDSLDSETFQNFRPISNLKFISKIIEKAVSSQLIDHLKINDLEDLFQSAYKKFHSTETALYSRYKVTFFTQ